MTGFSRRETAVVPGNSLPPFLGGMSWKIRSFGHPLIKSTYLIAFLPFQYFIRQVQGVVASSTLLNSCYPFVHWTPHTIMLTFDSLVGLSQGYWFQWFGKFARTEKFVCQSVRIRPSCYLLVCPRGLRSNVG